MLKSLKAKLKRDKFPKESPPREAQAINQEYSQLCQELGRSEYNIYAWQQNAEVLKKKILDIDVEMNARAALDKEAAQAKPVEEVKPEVVK